MPHNLIGLNQLCFEKKAFGGWYKIKRSVFAVGLTVLLKYLDLISAMCNSETVKESLLAYSKGHVPPIQIVAIIWLMIL